MAFRDRSPEFGKKLPVEIERKFRVIDLPINLDQYPSEEIEQGYILRGEKGVFRLRRIGMEYFMTFKGSEPDSSKGKVEVNVMITDGQFADLWPTTEGDRIEKTRYYIRCGDHTIELDIFEGENLGGVLAEVEFSSVYEAQLFDPPEWLGEDVSADVRYGNSSIASYGFPDD